jgi:hypothetical protein
MFAVLTLAEVNAYTVKLFWKETGCWGGKLKFNMLDVDSNEITF